MEEFTQYFQSPTIQRIGIILIISIIIFTISRIIKKYIPKYIKETNSRYRLRKFINYASYFFLVLVIMLMYSSQLSGLHIFLGVAGAGVAFALQEVITSIAGFMAINFSNYFSVGDRVRFGGIKGDVIDISILRTSIMEIGDWIDGDLYNGKIVRVANSFIFKDPVYNYSGEFPFLWDEITIPIRTDCDYMYANQVFNEILNDIQGEYAKNAQIHWDKMTEKLMIEDAKVSPMVTLAFDENWITYTLRYVVDFQSRRITKDTVYKKVLEAINNSSSKIVIASTSIEVTNR